MKFTIQPIELPIQKIVGDYIYNFWQDENNPRGIWRRTTLKSYLSEDTEGGHAGASTNEQRAQMNALIYIYLQMKLMN